MQVTDAVLNEVRKTFQKDLIKFILLGQAKNVTSPEELMAAYWPLTVGAKLGLSWEEAPEDVKDFYIVEASVVVVSLAAVAPEMFGL